MLDFLFTLLFPLLGALKSESFPEKLSLEDEIKYLKEFRNGSSDARARLIEHNLRLVAHIVKKYENTGEDRDDLLSIGIIGLIKAVDTFNHDSLNKLGTYAARCIENEILMHIRFNKNKKNQAWLNSPIGSDYEGNEIQLIDVIKDESIEAIEGMVLDESIGKLNKALNKLSKREYEIIIRRYGLNKQKAETQKEIANDLNISRSYVSRIEKRALMKLYLELLE